MKQVAGASTYTYSYQGLNILYEKNVTGSTTTVTKHFYANGLQVAKMVASSVYYLHEDALGSVRLVATTSVTITFSSNYVPYGSNYAMVGKEVFMYTGKMYDSSTGLYYYEARFYDDNIGRFITQDAYAGDRNDPMTMNLYAYTRDNPERYTDPTGHMLYIGEAGGDPSLVPPQTPVLTVIGITTSYVTTKSTKVVTVTTPTSIRTSTTTTIITMTTTVTTATTNGVSVITTTSNTVTTIHTSSVMTTTVTAPAGDGFNWNAAESLGVLIGGTVLATASFFSGNPLLFAGSASGAAETFEYLKGNPSPDPNEAAKAFLKGFTGGIVCEYFNAAC